MPPWSISYKLIYTIGVISISFRTWLHYLTICSPSLIRIRHGVLKDTTERNNSAALLWQYKGFSLNHYFIAVLRKGSELLIVNLLETFNSISKRFCCLETVENFYLECKLFLFVFIFINILFQTTFSVVVECLFRAKLPKQSTYYIRML